MLLVFWCCQGAHHENGNISQKWFKELDRNNSNLLSLSLSLSLSLPLSYSLLEIVLIAKKTRLLTHSKYYVTLDTPVIVCLA